MLHLPYLQQSSAHAISLILFVTRCLVRLLDPILPVYVHRIDHDYETLRLRLLCSPNISKSKDEVPSLRGEMPLAAIVVQHTGIYLLMQIVVIYR